MAKLGVNIDHVATLREVRRARYPDPVQAAFLAEGAGAHQITVHLREDRRHIQDRDLRLLRDTVATSLNLEMAVTAEMLKIALQIRPDRVTLVPERREELTTEGGLDVLSMRDAVQKTTAVLQEAGVAVSTFIDPRLDQVKASHMAGVTGIEIHTGRYAECRGESSEQRKKRQEELGRIDDACRLGEKLGIRVAAGHGLDLQNVGPLVKISGIEEFNIGHSIVARAVFVGFPEAVREMLRALGNAV